MDTKLECILSLSGLITSGSSFVLPVVVGDMSQGRQQAFEIFKRDYHENGLIEQNKSELRQKYAEAKRLGEKVNIARNVISEWRDNHIIHIIHRQHLKLGLLSLAEAWS